MLTTLSISKEDTMPYVMYTKSELYCIHKASQKLCSDWFINHYIQQGNYFFFFVLSTTSIHCVFKPRRTNAVSKARL